MIFFTSDNISGHRGTSDVDTAGNQHFAVTHARRRVATTGHVHGKSRGREDAGEADLEHEAREGDEEHSEVERHGPCFSAS